MMDVRKRFETALNGVLREWEENENARGAYVYGAFVRGTLTLNSVLDLCIVWNEDEAPAPLMAEHESVRVSMVFFPAGQIEMVLRGTTDDAFRIADVVGRLKDARVVLDKDGTLDEWLRVAADYSWPEEVIAAVKERAIKRLDEAERACDREDVISAVELVRDALFDLGRVILMRNNLYCIIRPAEVLTEVRMLDPIAYQLFLRTFKLRGMEEDDLNDVLEDLRHWLTVAERRLTEEENIPLEAFEHFSTAQRGYESTLELTIEGDYELAVLELRRAIHALGRALLVTDGILARELKDLVDDLREHESEFYSQIFEEYGGYDFQVKGVTRSIGEARFIAQRL
ncbi:hypothetical protein DRO42_07845 [Candidatus Bathyarchaeota archaeon]|nr:MAG: hypothetical protein DRO42_07845 [Candidatus Bathyarchaeota archaeon]